MTLQSAKEQAEVATVENKCVNNLKSMSSSKLRPKDLLRGGLKYHKNGFISSL